MTIIQLKIKNVYNLCNMIEKNLQRKVIETYK